MEVTVKTRYSSKEASANIKQEGNTIRVVFDEPQRAITPGQSAVFYIGDIVLGGGKITEAVWNEMNYSFSMQNAKHFTFLRKLFEIYRK